MDTGPREQTSRRPLKSRDTGWAHTVARWLARMGLRPNTVSVGSVFFALGAAGSFWASANSDTLHPSGWLFIAAVFIQGRLLCNLFDGMIAIEGGFKTKSGEIYNELPDRLADLIIIGATGFAVGATHWQPELAWLTAGLAVTTAYVRALGVAAGATQKFHGPMAKPHRMALLTVATLACAIAQLMLNEPPPILCWALITLSVGCLITIFRRTRRIIAELEAR